VISDELVAVMPDPAASGFQARGTPFRKAPPGSARAAKGPRRLAALVELHQGPYALAPLPTAAAVRALIGSAAVPAGPPLWTAALAVIGRLAHDVPCYRMAWSPDDPPFERLADALRL
jgi:hypothetical protein